LHYSLLPGLPRSAVTTDPLPPIDWLLAELWPDQAPSSSALTQARYAHARWPHYLHARLAPSSLEQLACHAVLPCVSSGSSSSWGWAVANMQPCWTQHGSAVQRATVALCSACITS